MKHIGCSRRASWRSEINPLGRRQHQTQTYPQPKGEVGPRRFHDILLMHSPTLPGTPTSTDTQPSVSTDSTRGWEAGRRFTKNSPRLSGPEQSKPGLVLLVILVPFPLDLHPEVRWLDQVVVLFLIF